MSSTAFIEYLIYYFTNMCMKYCMNTWLKDYIYLCFEHGSYSKVIVK